MRRSVSDRCTTKSVLRGQDDDGRRVLGRMQGVSEEDPTGGVGRKRGRATYDSSENRCSMGAYAMMMMRLAH